MNKLNGQAMSLVYCPHPVLATVGREVRSLAVIEGESLERHLRRADLLHDGDALSLLAWVNGRLAPRSEWHRIYPRQGDHVVLRAAVHGGDGKNPIATVLSIAVIVFAAWVVGPNALALEGFGQAAVQAAVVVGGTLEIRAAAAAPPKLNEIPAQRTPETSRGSRR